MLGVMKALCKSPDKRSLRQQSDGRWQVCSGCSDTKGPLLNNKLVALMHAHDLIGGDDRKHFTITPCGRAWLRRALSLGDAFASQHQDRVREKRLDANGTPVELTVNAQESPLGWLYRRRDCKGHRFIEDWEFKAGERLRAAATRADILPPLSVNYDGLSAAGNSKGARTGGHHENTLHHVLQARAQLRAALDAVGPEMAGILLDVCCFLKGLEQVEQERGWPKRSAKIVLKLALQSLARHYGYAPAVSDADKDDTPHIRRWTTHGYRPDLRAPEYAGTT